jgi:quercetin dioxygenase-like cupin family protein
LKIPVLSTGLASEPTGILSLTNTAGVAERNTESPRQENQFMRLNALVAIPFLLAFAASGAAAQDTYASPPALKWGPAPAVFPAGAQMAVVQGDPSGNALFTVRLRLPNGYKFPPHTHPTDEHVTVISGTFLVGMGTSFDTKKMMKLTAGGFATAPAQGAHYALAKGPTEVQVHAIGPFAITYVNPADSPKVGGH